MPAVAHRKQAVCFYLIEIKNKPLAIKIPAVVHRKKITPTPAKKTKAN